MRTWLVLPSAKVFARQMGSDVANFFLQSGDDFLGVFRHNGPPPLLPRFSTPPLSSTPRLKAGPNLTVARCLR